MFLVVAYDIGDDGRRSRLARELENWGQRTQYSIFECDLSEAQAQTLVTRLGELWADGDSIRLYRVCAACLEKCVIIGGAPPAVEQDFYQV